MKLIYKGFAKLIKSFVIKHEFMVFGLNQNLVISCDKCQSGTALHLAMNQNNSSNLWDEYKCLCGNKFSYIKGIVYYLCSDHIFSMYDFISNIQCMGETIITVGVTRLIDLEKEVPIFNKIFLTPYDKFVDIDSKRTTSKSFRIISSQLPDNPANKKSMDAKFGEQMKIGWFVYGKTLDLKLEPWRQLLIQAKEQLIDRRYLLSYLSSAIALESYLNSRYTKYLKAKEIAEQGIEIFLKESSMPDKLFKLSISLLNLSINNLSISKKELENIISTRNKIAHGKLMEVNEKSAHKVFKNVLISIFEFEIGSKI